MTSLTHAQSVEDKAYQEIRDIPLSLDDHDSLAKHLICDETRLEELPSVPGDSYQNPASIGSQGNSTHTDDIYGNPPSAGSFGNPSSISSYGNPESISSYGNPASTSSYGNPASTSSYGNPASISENCGNIANTGNYGNPGSVGSFANPQSIGENYGNPTSVSSYGNPVTPRESHENLGDIPLPDNFGALQNNQAAQTAGITDKITANQQNNTLSQGLYNVGGHSGETVTEHNPRIAGQLSAAGQYYPNQQQYHNQSLAQNAQLQYRQQTHSLGTTQGASMDQMRKRRRFEYENWQTDYLEKCYRRNHYPGKYDKDEMSNISKLSQDRIKSWFQNRRARDRKRLKGRLTPGAPIPQGSVTVLEPTEGRKLQPNSVQWGGINSHQTHPQQQQSQQHQHIRPPQQQQQKGAVPQQIYNYPFYYAAVPHSNPHKSMATNTGGVVGARPPHPVRMVGGYPGQERVLNHTHPASHHSSFQSTETNQYQDSRAHSRHAPLAMVPVSSDESSSSTDDDDDEVARSNQQTSAEVGLKSAAVTEPIKTADVLNVANPSGTYVNAGSVQDMTSYVDPRIRSVPEYLMRYGAQSGSFPAPNQLQHTQVPRGYSNQGYMNMQQYAATEHWRQMYLGQYMYQNNNRGAVPSTYPNFYSVVGQKDPNSLYYARQFVPTTRQGGEASVSQNQNSVTQMPNTFTVLNYNATTNTSGSTVIEHATTTKQTSSYGDTQDYNNNHSHQYNHMYSSQANLPSMEAFRQSSSTSTTDSQDNELPHTPASSHLPDSQVNELSNPPAPSRLTDSQDNELSHAPVSPHLIDLQSPPANPGVDIMKESEPQLDFENAKTSANTDVYRVAPSTFQSEYSNHSQDSVDISFDDQVETDPFSVMTQSPALTSPSDPELSPPF